MNLSAPFIDRPVATTLLTLGVALAGAIAFRLLPVSPLPQVDFPTISVQASLPGASPETMAATVAMPLERSLGRISDVTEMTSSSSLGSTRITLQFDINRDIDGAARDVQAAINAARSLLPTGLPSNPTYRKVNPADAPIMILALTSDTMTQGQMYDAASTIIAQKLSQVAGVGQVSVGGSSLPAVRVELNPASLNNYGVGLEQVRATLNAANANRPKGAVEDGDRRWQIYANDQAKSAADYLPLVVSYRNGAAIQLSDVADVVDSVQDLRNAGMANGKPSVLVIVNRQPNANIIETVDRVTALLPSLRASIPGAITLTPAMERTATIRASLRDTGRALGISVMLVVLVVFVFLRSVRATLIPAVAVPVSLVGTFGAMYLLGFSVNNFTLMALTIATGFVVDDAIVVLENTSRHIEKGMPPFAAALQGAREVGFTVLAMSLSLIAVFIPILMMGGIVGRLFREFAITLSVAILVSLVVSLTTTPMMCARLLRPPRDGPRGRLYRWSEAGFAALHRGYRRSLGFVLGHGPWVMLVLLATVCLNVYLYVVIPKGFFPQQDTGRLVGGIQGDQSISFQAMRQKLADFMTIVSRDPAVENVVGFTGGAQRNSGMMFVALKPLTERTETADQVVARLRGKLAKEPGANLFLQPVQDIRIGGRASNAQYQFTLQADDLAELRAWEPRIRVALSALPALADVNTDTQDKGLQTSLVIDRDSASRLGISPSLIDATLNDLFGQRQVSTIYAQLNQYHVVMEAAPEYWQSPDALKTVYISTPGGAQVPLSAIATYGPTNTPLGVNHQGQFVASTISFNLAPGVSLSQATRDVDDALARIGVPNTVRGSFQGSARAFQASLNSQPWLILAALLTVYIVLGVLYESYVHPLTILSTLPSAGVGALLALMLFKTDFSIIAFIGVILLIGIVKKNAIMMIDVALAAERDHGMNSRDAIFEACLLRFRPIMMTTLAAMLGALPLALGAGDGAEMRRPLGIAIVGGLLLSQVLTLYTTPVVYLYLDRFRLWAAHAWTRSRGAAAVAATAAVLSGCMVGPDYARPAAPVPLSYKELPGWKVATPVDDAPRGNWWEAFNDADLNALEAQVATSNQTIQAAEARMREATAATEGARAALFPFVGASGAGVRSSRGSGSNASTSASSGATNSYNVALSASWEVDLWGGIRRSIEASTSGTQATTAELAGATLSAQALLAQDYLLLRVQDAQVALLRDTVASYERSLQLTRNQYAAGIVGRGDVAQAEAQLNSTQAQVVDATLARAQLEHAIAVLVGKPPAEFAIAPRTLVAVFPDIPVALPSTLLERRPDIAAAERRAASANAQIGVAQAAFFPALTLSAGGGLQNSLIGDLISLPSRYWSLGAALAQPIFDAGLRSAQKAQAVATYDETVANYRSTVLAGFQDVEDNLAALELLKQEAAYQAEAVRAAQQSATIAVNQYKAGTASYLAVVVLQASALNSERTALVILGRRLTASVGLVKALGGGWDAQTLAQAAN